jgi:hypothetical protein
MIRAALGSRSRARIKSDLSALSALSAGVLKRFRTHAAVVVVIVVCVVIILVSHSARLRLEWGTGGFVLGLIAGAIVALDIRRHRKRDGK